MCAKRSRLKSILGEKKKKIVSQFHKAQDCAQLVFLVCVRCSGEKFVVVF